jgi:outer membrane protein OmpA-like peptidoglycan-associated protein
MTKGPQIKGMISARSADRIQVTAADGTNTIIAVNDNTQVKSSGGFLGMGGSKLATTSLLNGLPVTVDTLQSGSGLYASKISLQNKDLKTAAMIRNGTDQRFAEQTAATEALRSRVADIGNYNVKGTTNVNFDTGKAVLSEQAKADLCTAATQAQGMNNALLLVVGYTDSTGSEEFNQELSEKRAGRVVNYLQQACGWKPYRMLTPTGMAEADPLADNTTYEGKAQNRRVAVNILVSKGLDGM